MTPQARWLEYLRVERGRSTNTISTYARTLRTLPADPLGMTREAVEAWFKGRARDADGNERPHSSRNNELSAVRSFFKWSVRYELRDDDPTSRIDQLRTQSRESKFVGQSDLDFLLRKLPPDLKRAVALGAYGGLRVSEAAALDWDMIDLDARFMRIRGKGRKERIAGLSPKLLDEILPNTGGNVVMAGGNPYSADTLQRRVNRFLTSLDIDATFHKLRARYVTQAISETGDIFAVSRAVGWSSIETARSYAALSDDALHRIAAAASR